MIAVLGEPPLEMCRLSSSLADVISSGNSGLLQLFKELLVITADRCVPAHERRFCACLLGLDGIYLRLFRHFEL
jgi:hypothetical protein